MKQVRRGVMLLAMAHLLFGCHRLPLQCRSEYLYPDYLASEQVLTPDPCRRCFYGQQIVVDWDLPRGPLPSELRLYIRYGTRELTTFVWPLATAHGWRIYQLINDDYWSREGIVSYKAEIYGGNQLLVDWSHHLWTEVIQLHNDL